MNNIILYNIYNRIK